MSIFVELLVNYVNASTTTIALALKHGVNYFLNANRLIVLDMRHMRATRVTWSVKWPAIWCSSTKFSAQLRSSWPGASFQNRAYWDSIALFWISEDTVSSSQLILCQLAIDEEGTTSSIIIWMHAQLIQNNLAIWSILVDDESTYTDNVFNIA
jgi:hypothetical protein